MKLCNLSSIIFFLLPKNGVQTLLFISGSAQTTKPFTVAWLGGHMTCGTAITLTWYCSSAPSLSFSSWSSCFMAACRALSLARRSFSSSCFSASVSEMARCCRRWICSSSALLVDSSSNNLHHTHTDTLAKVSPEHRCTFQAVLGPALQSNKSSRVSCGFTKWSNWHKLVVNNCESGMVSRQQGVLWSRNQIFFFLPSSFLDKGPGCNFRLHPLGKCCLHCLSSGLKQTFRVYRKKKQQIKLLV